MTSGNNIIVTSKSMTIEALARQNNVSVEALREVNGLSGNTIPANTSIEIPSAKHLAAVGVEINNRVSNAPAPEGSVSAAALTSADSSRRTNQVAGFMRGAWNGLSDLVVGVADMGVGVVNLTGVRGAEAQQKTMTTLKNVTSTIAKDPGAVWDALKQPYVDAWDKGEYGEALGRGAFDVLTTIGTGGFGGAAKGGVQVGTKVAVVAKTVGKVDDLVRVADTMGDLGRTARAAGTGRGVVVSKGLTRTDDVAGAAAKATKTAAGGVDDALLRATLDDPARLDQLADAMQKAGGRSSSISLLRNYASRLRSGATDAGTANELATARRMTESTLRTAAGGSDDLARVLREAMTPAAAKTATTAGATSAGKAAGATTGRTAGTTAGTTTAARSAADAIPTGSLADRLKRIGVGANVLSLVALTRLQQDPATTELFDANNPAHLAALQKLVEEGNAPAVEEMLRGVPPEVVQGLVEGKTPEVSSDDSAIAMLAQALREGGVPLDSPALKEMLTAAMGAAAAGQILQRLEKAQASPGAGVEGVVPSGELVPGAEVSGAPVDPTVLGQLSASQARVVDAGVGPHEIKAGETLDSIAAAYDTTPERLLALNPGLKELGPDASLTGLLINVPIGSSAVQPEVSARPIPTSGANAYSTPAASLDAVRAGNGVVQRGMGGASVMDVQRMLNAAGATPPLAVDGKFGPKTEAALKAFQSSQGVQQTGVLGAVTVAKLDAAPPAPAGALPVARTETGPISGGPLATQIGDRAEREARRMGTTGACALAVNNVLTGMGIGGRDHAYAKAEQLAGDSRFREVNVSPGDLANLPRGAVVVWGRSEAKPWGHVSVALGNGTEASDHIEQQKTGGKYGTDFGRGPDPQGRQFRVFVAN